MKVSELFEESPGQWGLRGDPLLWKELKETFKMIDMPDSVEAFRALLEAEYIKSTGLSMSDMKPVFIERFKSQGMSSGMISPEFWIKQAIPLLVDHYKKMIIMRK